MGDVDKSENIELPAIVEQAVASVPETWRQKAALAVFKVIAGSAGPGVAKARDNWALMNARERVTSAIADEVAKRAVADSQIMDRAMSHMISEEFRSQSNRESIAAMALEDLSDAASGEPNAPSSDEDQLPPDEDWLTKFSKYSEQISNDDMQRMWARVLSGEIRRRGSYSLRTLRFLSDLDRETGEIFQDISQHNLARNALFLIPAEYSSGNNHHKITRLLDAGLIVERPGTTSRPPGLSKNGSATIYYGSRLALLITPSIKTNIPIVQLSTVGKELLQLLPQSDELKTLTAIANYLRSKESAIASTKIAMQIHNGDTTNFVHISDI